MIDVNCVGCFQKQAWRFFEKFNVPEDRRQYLNDHFKRFLQEEGVLYPSPYSAQYLNRLIKEETGIDDLFQEEKKHYNGLLLERYSDLKREVRNSPEPRKAALSYALAGNIIDFGPPQQFDLDKTFSEALDKKPAIDDSEMLLSEIDKADMVLYIGDNAGEIVTDKLFIETLGHPNVVFATRGGVVLNDVTREDAMEVGMEEVAHVIDNGFDAPSTMPEFCSPAFRGILEGADVIISKGQGNFEGLHDYHRRSNLFFLLMVKCSEIANVTGQNQGDAIIMNGQRIEEKMMADD